MEMPANQPIVPRDQLPGSLHRSSAALPHAKELERPLRAPSRDNSWGSDTPVAFPTEHDIRWGSFNGGDLARDHYQFVQFSRLSRVCASRRRSRRWALCCQTDRLFGLEEVGEQLADLSEIRVDERSDENAG